MFCGRHMRDGQGNKGLESWLQKTYHVVGYMRENRKSKNYINLGLDHVISTEAKGIELIKVGLETIL